MGVEVKLDGIADILDQLYFMSVNLEKEIEPILQRAGQPLLKTLQETGAFKDVSGKLRRSFKISRLRNSRMNRNGRWFIWVGDVDREAPHGWLVEYGTSRAPARPFMEPAHNQHEAEIFQDIYDGVKEALSK